MKRGIVLLIILVLAVNAALAAEAPRGYLRGEGWQYYMLGQYPQTADGGCEPLLWRALYLENNRLTLIAERVIDARQVIFEDDETIIKEHAYRRIESFLQSDLCGWMNTELLETIFGETGLQNALVETEYGFCYPLTDAQLRTSAYGFSTNRKPSRSRRAKPTEYAVARGVYRDYDGTAPYWTATIKSKGGYMLMMVGFDGHISYGAYTRVNVGLRPSVTLDMSRIEMTGGDGSVDNPFHIAVIQND